MVAVVPAITFQAPVHASIRALFDFFLLHAVQHVVHSLDMASNLLQGNVPRQGRSCCCGVFCRRTRRKVLVVRHQVARNLVLDKEVHQIFCQLNLLRQRTAGEVQQPFELRLDLYDANRKERSGKLHVAERLRKALLLWRQGRYCVFELLCRWDRLQEQFQGQLVLVLHDDGVRGTKLVLGGKGANEQNVRLELARPGNELDLLGARPKRVPHHGVEKPPAAEGDLRRGVQGELHRDRFWGLSDGRRDWSVLRLVGTVD